MGVSGSHFCSPKLRSLFSISASCKPLQQLAKCLSSQVNGTRFFRCRKEKPFYWPTYLPALSSNSVCIVLILGLSLLRPQDNRLVATCSLSFRNPEVKVTILCPLRSLPNAKSFWTGSSYLFYFLFLFVQVTVAESGAFPSSQKCSWASTEYTVLATRASLNHAPHPSKGLIDPGILQH